MQSRNKREGQYCGTFKGKHYRDSIRAGLKCGLGSIGAYVAFCVRKKRKSK